jgi:hypothetical protein
MADTTNILSVHSHEGEGGRVGEWGKRERRGRGGGSLSTSAPFLFPRRGSYVGSCFGRNQPTWYHRLASGKCWGVCGGGGTELHLRAGDVRGSS